MLFCLNGFGLKLCSTSENIAKQVLNLENPKCPWWLVWNETDGSYECGSSIRGTVVNGSAGDLEVQLYDGFCIQQSIHGNATVLGSCKYGV